MNNRIRDIRLKLGMNQSEFSSRIGIGQAALSAIEKGIRNITERTIKDICREFTVNEDWLRSGEGEMFEELTEQQKIMKYTAMLLKDTDFIVADAIKNFIITYEQLDDSSKAVLEQIAVKYIENMKK